MPAARAGRRIPTRPAAGERVEREMQMLAETDKQAREGHPKAPERPVAVAVADRIPAETEARGDWARAVERARAGGTRMAAQAEPAAAAPSGSFLGRRRTSPSPRGHHGERRHILA